MQNKMQPTYLFIPLIYLLMGLIWISLSDELLFALSGNLFPEKSLEMVGKLKGYFYVVITTILLYFLIRIHVKSLIASKNNFKRLFKENPNPMWIYDLDTLEILFANNAACQEYGYSHEEFIKLNLYDLSPEIEYQKLKQSITHQQDGYTNSGQWLHKDKNNNLFYVNIFSHNTTYHSRKCRIVTAINIHQKVLTELENNNIQQALNKATLVCITDLKGHVLEVNEKFCEVCQYPKEKLIGKIIYQTIGADYHPKEFWAEMWENILAGKTWRADVKNKTKNGNFYWVDTVISPVFNTAGEIYKFISVGYDITEKKRLEKNQQALLEDLSDYAFQTSHELRGPLARMLGLISIFHDYPEPDIVIDKIKITSEELDKVIRRMNDSLNRHSQEIVIEKRNGQKKNR